MTPCPSCNRHVRSADATCPFCAAPRPSSRALRTLGGAVTALVLAACYGSPMKPDDSGLDTSAVDGDSDGYTLSEDCDDTNAAVNPGAVEVCDDTVDNDCDTKTDVDDEDCAGK